MKTIHEIKAEKEDKVSEVIKACSMFFAFSNQQFAENKTPLSEGEKYVSLGAGIFLPKSKLDQYIQGVDDTEKWYKAEIKNNKQRYAHIMYELGNHEAWYTGEIEETCDALGDDYTVEEVRAIFKNERVKQLNLREA